MVILIISIVTSGFVALFVNYLLQSRVNTTETRVLAIEEALDRYLRINGRYPCAAPLGAADINDEYGYELGDIILGTTCLTAAQSMATTTVNGTAGNSVRIGAVPTRTIGLPDDHQVDGWGRKFTYAVTEILATDGSFDRNGGAITVIDSQDNNVTNPAGSSHLVVISHGPDGSGGILPGSGVDSPCIVGEDDTENCDGDATFRTTLLRSTVSGIATHFDDYTFVKSISRTGDIVPDGAVVPFNLNVCPAGWDTYDPAFGREVIVATYDTADPPVAQNFDETYTVAEHGRAGVSDWTVNDGTLENADTGGFAYWVVDETETTEQPLTVFLANDPNNAAAAFSQDALEYNAPLGGSLLAATGADDELFRNNRQPYVSLLYCCRNRGGGNCP